MNKLPINSRPLGKRWPMKWLPFCIPCDKVGKNPYHEPKKCEAAERIDAA